MAFGRKWLAEVIRSEDLSPEEKEKKIMDEHISVTDGLKDERDSFKEAAKKAEDLQKQLDEKNGGEDYKQKYEDEHKAFEDFKKQVETNAAISEIKAACKKVLVEEGISESRADGILKVFEARGDLAKIKRDKDGNIEDIDGLKKTINDEWGDWKTTITQKGAKVEKPPKTGKATMTKDEIMAIQDTQERQKAIFENKELFGIT